MFLSTLFSNTLNLSSSLKWKTNVDIHMKQSQWPTGV
jgi:hypothetical protein